MALRGVVIQPGAIGDCVLTLPLIEFMKERLGLGVVDIFGHTEYTGIFPGRTAADAVYSIDAMELHRLFVHPKDFDPADGDPLIKIFADYAWIVTFLGEAGGSFEQNLIFTVHCSHNAEIITLSMKPPENSRRHITDFHISQLAAESGLKLRSEPSKSRRRLIRPAKADHNVGATLLRQQGIKPDKKLVIIQPGSGGRQKCWQLDNFLALAAELKLRDMEVIFLLGPAEVEVFAKDAIKKISSAAATLTELPLVEVCALLTAPTDSSETTAELPIWLRQWV